MIDDNAPGGRSLCLLWLISDNHPPPIALADKSSPLLRWPGSAGVLSQLRTVSHIALACVLS